MKYAVVLSLMAGLSATLVHAIPNDWPSVSSKHIIKRDVIVIGGGSSGIFAAAKLQRLGKTVAIVERLHHFGGHTSTYHVPYSNITIDYGVQAYSDTKVVRDHFARFDIPVKRLSVTELGDGKPNYVDFRNGQAVKDFNVSLPPDFSGYREQGEKYPSLYYSTVLPDPVPEDLLLPFGAFLKKYKIQDKTYSLFYSVEGLGDLLAQTTLYVLRYFNREYLDGLDHGKTLVTTRRYNQELYDKALEQMRNDAFVDSEVLDSRRSKSGVWVYIQTPNGRRLLLAKRLLITVPPVASNMRVFDLEESEECIFDKFHGSGWYVGLIKATGLPANYSYQNTRQDTSWNLPELPSLYQISPTGVKDIYLVRYGSQKHVPVDTVRRNIMATVDMVRIAMAKDPKGIEPAELLTFSSHYPFSLKVPPKEIRNGFYTKLDRLQGQRSTWYTGAAFISHSTGALWNFTDHLVDRMYKRDIC